MISKLMAAIAVALLAVALASPAEAKKYKVQEFCGDRYCDSNVAVAREANTSRRYVRGKQRHRAVQDANGNGAARVCASGGRLCVNVAASAQSTLQCVVNRVEAAGVRIKALGGIRGGRCSTRSMHPCGTAIDINQTARDINGPPRSVSSAAASACGAVSGSWWAKNPDNGHFQVGGWAGTHERGTRTYAALRHHRHKNRIASR